MYKYYVICYYYIVCQIWVNMANATQTKMDWNDVIKKEARGTDDIDLG
jgi:hypothetical protein